MSQQNVETLRRIWPSKRMELVGMFKRLDVPAGLASAMAPDAEVVFGPGGPVGEARNYRGFQGLADGWADWLEPYEEYWLSVEELADAAEDKVLMLANVRARTWRDRVMIEHSPAAVFELSDGTITRIAFYLDRVEAFEAAGLSE